MSSTPPLSRSGFTLVETVVTIAIFALVAGALSSMIVFIYKNNTYVLEESRAVQSAQVGLGSALELLRQASYGDDGSYPIQTAGTSTVTFYSDTNNDGAIEKVVISLIKGKMYEAVTKSAGNPPSYVGQAVSTTTIASYVVNDSSLPLFQYSDESGTTLSSPVDVSQVASMNANLKVDVNTNRSPVPYTLLGSATLRNLR